MKEIKSSYFITKIFYFINEKRKLDLVKYSKNYQILLELNIINYRALSGRYIVKEEKGIIKEYDEINGILIYEGDYLNGKRHGKGKEYDKCISKYDTYLSFEGEYKNGKRYKGKEYYKDGNIKYEGEYLNGKIWTGKIYDKEENILCEINQGKGYIKEIIKFHFFLKFEGYYLNGERNGNGKEYNNEEYLIFNGEYKNGKKWNGNGYDNSYNIVYEINNGKGYIKEYDEFHGFLKFEGEFYNGEKNGKGKVYDYDGNIIFEGEYSNGQRNGKGKKYYNNGQLKFEGEYLYNNRRKGKSYFSSGELEFEGEYLNKRKYNGKGYDKKGNMIYEIKNGNGKVREYDYDDDLIFEGEYLNGKRKKGIEYKKDVLSQNKHLIYFEGEYMNGFEWNGKKNVYNEINDVIFEGGYLNGKYNGKCKEYYDNKKLKFEGEYLNGEKNGKGKEYYENEKLKFEGEYLNNHMLNGKGYDAKGNLAFEINNGKGYIKEYDNYDGILKFEGEYLNGQRYKGKEYEHEYRGAKYLIYEGEFLNKERTGQGKTYSGNKLISEGE